MDSAPASPGSPPGTTSSATPVIRRGVWKRRLLGLAFGCCLALILLKVCDIAVGWVKDSHSRHLLRLVPQVAVRHHTTEFDYVFHTNRLGFRGPDVAPAKTPGTSRIVVLGDSFVAGSGVPDADVFTQQLQSKWNQAQPNRPVEIVNLGRVGSSPIRELDLYEKFGRPFQSDLVILTFFLGNDLVEAVEEHRVDELAGWRPPGLIRGTAYRCYPNLYLELAMATQARREQREQKSRARDDLMGEFRREAVRRGMAPEQAEQAFQQLPEAVKTAAADGLFPQQRLFEAVFQPDRHRQALDPDDPFFNRSWPRVRQALDSLHSRVTADGARLLALVIPDAMQVSPDAADFNRSLGFEVEAHWLHEVCRTQTALTEWAQGAHVPLLDLTTALRQSPIPAYYVWDVHLTSHGQALVADELLKWQALRDALGNPKSTTRQP